MPDPDRLVLTGMEFHAHHGALQEEARLGARFIVDLELELAVSDEDRLEETVDYSRLYRLVSSLVTGSRHRLIETLATTIANGVMESEILIQTVTVRVHKPHAPLPGVIRDVYVEIKRTRGDGQRDG